MDGKERVARVVRPPPPTTRPHPQPKPTGDPSSLYPYTDSEVEGNPYEYIEDHDKQRTHNSIKKSHAGR